MAHCLLRALDLLSIGVVDFHLPTQKLLKKIFHLHRYCEQIAILELSSLKDINKLRSQFPYLSCKFGVVREFVSKTLLYFCYNSLIKQEQPVNLSLNKKKNATHSSHERN